MDDLIVKLSPLAVGRAGSPLEFVWLVDGLSPWGNKKPIPGKSRGIGRISDILRSAESGVPFSIR